MVFKAKNMLVCAKQNVTSGKLKELTKVKI